MFPGGNELNDASDTFEKCFVVLGNINRSTLGLLEFGNQYAPKQAFKNLPEVPNGHLDFINNRIDM